MREALNEGIHRPDPGGCFSHSLLSSQRWAAAVTEQQRAVAEATASADARIADLDRREAAAATASANASAAIRDAERTTRDALSLEETCAKKGTELNARAIELRSRESEIENARESLAKARDALSAQQVRVGWSIAILTLLLLYV